MQLHHLITQRQQLKDGNSALVHGEASLSRSQLLEWVLATAEGLMSAGLGDGDRVGIYLNKRFETVGSPKSMVCTTRPMKKTTAGLASSPTLKVFQVTRM